MEFKSLKIIFFDGSFKSTPFINRLILGLSDRHQLCVLVESEKMDGNINETLALLQDEIRLQELYRLSREKAMEYNWKIISKQILDFYLKLSNTTKETKW